MAPKRQKVVEPKEGKENQKDHKELKDFKEYKEAKDSDAKLHKDKDHKEFKDIKEIKEEMCIRDSSMAANSFSPCDLTSCSPCVSPTHISVRK